MFNKKKRGDKDKEEKILEEITSPEEQTALKEEDAPKVVRLLKLEKVYTAFFDVYTSWFKPIRDNWEHMKRRLNALFTWVSLLFFVVYIPLLLFGKIANGLNLGWEIALYVCVGVYAFTLVALLVLTLAFGRSNSTDAAKKRKRLMKVVLLIARIASLAIGITALVITDNAQPSALNTLGMVLAIVSIIFAVIPLIFGGLAGFVRWLISAPKIKYKFSFVALEWNDLRENSKLFDKNANKLAKRYGDRINVLINDCFLPAFGEKYIKSVTPNDIMRALSAVGEADKNLAEWTVKSIFDYAEGVYVENNVCLELELEGDIEKEAKIQKHNAAEGQGGLFRRVTSLFRKKNAESAPAEEE